PGAMAKAGTLFGSRAVGTPGKLAIRVNPWGVVTASDTSRVSVPVFLTVNVFDRATPTVVLPNATVPFGGTTVAPSSTGTSGVPAWANRPAPTAAAASRGSAQARGRARGEDRMRVMISLLPNRVSRSEADSRPAARTLPVRRRPAAGARPAR